MSERETELEQSRAGASCCVLREHNTYQVDKGESTRNCQTWQRSTGVIVIVSHDGRGSWGSRRPGSDRACKSSLFSLTRYLDPSLTCGQVGKRLHGGMTARATDKKSISVAGWAFTVEVQ